MRTPSCDGGRGVTIAARRGGGHDPDGVGRLRRQRRGHHAGAPAGDTFDVAILCVFPDHSFIDDWGITYYAGGVVRGIDLKTVFRYQPTTLPAMYTAKQS